MTRKSFNFEKIGILGLGVSGLGCLEFLKEKEVQVEVFCQNESLIAENENYHKDNNFNVDVELLILSPGISREHKLVKHYEAKNISVISEIELAYYFCNKPIVAVTGSNGKTTTVSVLAQAFEKAGLRVGLCGNIGKTFISTLKEQDKLDLFVIELSSFQLESCFEFRPDISVLLNCKLTHEERYKDFEQYLDAKLRISQNLDADSHFICSKELCNEVSAHTNIHFIEVDDYSDLDPKSISLVGRFNYNNLAFCQKIFSLLKKMKFQDLDKKSFDQGLCDFQAVAHRMERFHPRVINDSKSTNFHSTLAAIESLEGEKVCLVMGGKVRDPMDEQKLALFHEIASKAYKVLAFGEAISEIPAPSVSDLSELKAELSDDVIILFSPGYPSFDSFKSYAERGNYFKSIFS